MADDDFDMMQGRGAALKGYAVKDDAWPALWRMPDALFDQVNEDETADIADKVTPLVDDFCLRAAINVYDNCARLPGSETGVVAGLMGAMTRFMTPLTAHLTDAEIAAHGAALGEAIAGQIMRWRDVMANGWEGAAEAIEAREGAASAEGGLERCIACAEPMLKGQLYLFDVSGGVIHAGCCGPEREGYAHLDGEPLGPDELLPSPMIWPAS